jgi:hypothetical protein
MIPVSNRNFGLLIAYLVPGFVALHGLTPHWPVLQAWLGGPSGSSATVGGFLYVTIASTAAGMTLSTIRWLVLDHLHAITGLPPPRADFSRLQANVDAYQAAIEYHYRYYQFYGSSIFAVFVVLIGRWPLVDVLPAHPRLAVLLLIMLSVLFFAASRDALRKYYTRTRFILTNMPSNQETHHDQRCSTSPDARDQDCPKT